MIRASRSLSLPIFLSICSSGLGACATVSPGAPASFAQGGGARDNRIDVTVGYRELDDEWSPIDEQTALGVEYSRMFGDGRFAWSVGGSYSSEEKSVTGSPGGAQKALQGDGVPVSFDLTGTLWQVDVGLRMFFTDPDNRVRPYVGAGVAFVQAEAEASGGINAEDDDTSVGGLLRGGVDFRVSQAVYLGLELRTLLGTDIDVGGANFDADYVQLGFVLGFAF